METVRVNRGQRIAQEVALIRAVLKEHGYCTRKQPNQPVWIVYVTEDKYYRLTYQPAPIIAWLLHPQDNDASRSKLLSLIQQALAGQPSSTGGVTTYLERLHPWCVTRTLSSMQRPVVARFRRRNEAEEYLRSLRQLIPTTNYEIIFEPPANSQTLPNERGQTSQ